MWLADHVVILIIACLVILMMNIRALASALFVYFLYILVDSLIHRNGGMLLFIVVTFVLLEVAQRIHKKVIAQNEQSEGSSIIPSGT